MNILQLSDEHLEAVRDCLRAQIEGLENHNESEWNAETWNSIQEDLELFKSALQATYRK